MSLNKPCRSDARERQTAQSRLARVVRPAAAGLLTIAVVGLTSCANNDPHGGRWSKFGLPEPASDRAPHIGNLWIGGWWAALVIGVLMWGLMGWAFFRYRRRHADQAPKQTRYNLPLEIMYTLVPFLIVGVLFFWTVQTQDTVLAKDKPSTHNVHVIGQKWSWTFNYMEEGAWEAGTIERTPTLVLPVNEPVTFTLDSPDVIHSFWVPQFYMKMDVIPGRTNSFQVTPTVQGEFRGKCAELCGTYHSAMLFNVKVVDRTEYQRYIDDLKARGQVGNVKGTEGVTTLTEQRKEGE